MIDIKSISKKLITQNIIINLVGNVTPMFFAIATIPFVIETIGKEKFGILSIAWLFLGYFSFLDLGIGRATTKFVVEYYNQGRHSEIRNLIWTSSFSLFIIGLFAGALLFLATPLVVDRFLNIPEYLKDETRKSFYLISASIPFVIGVASLRGVLEAQQKFRLLNIIKIPSSILNYIIPATVALFSNSLTPVVLLLTVTRILLLFVYAYFCFMPLKDSGAVKGFDVPLIKKLLSYGGWLTVSNVIGPIMIYFDRFLIGSVLTLTLLTYYTTPYEIITKLLIIAGSATGVLFPIFANLFLTDTLKLNDIYNKSLKAILFILFPVALFFAFFSNEILYLWLGSDFSDNSSIVLQLLSLGVLVNSIAAIPFTAIQALNRPDIPAKVHMLELPAYLITLLVSAYTLGVAGVALAWMLRNFVDSLVFLYLYKRLTHGSLKTDLKTFVLLFFLVLACFAASLLTFRVISWPYKIPLYSIVFLLFALVFWFKALNTDERSTVRSLLKKWYA